ATSASTCASSSAPRDGPRGPAPDRPREAEEPRVAADPLVEPAHAGLRRGPWPPAEHAGRLANVADVHLLVAGTPVVVADRYAPPQRLPEHVEQLEEGRRARGPGAHVGGLAGHG